LDLSQKIEEIIQKSKEKKHYNDVSIQQGFNGNIISYILS